MCSSYLIWCCEADLKCNNVFKIYLHISIPAPPPLLIWSPGCLRKSAPQICCRPVRPTEHGPTFLRLFTWQFTGPPMPLGGNIAPLQTNMTWANEPGAGGIGNYIVVLPTLIFFNYEWQHCKLWEPLLPWRWVWQCRVLHLILFLAWWIRNNLSTTSTKNEEEKPHNNNFFPSCIISHSTNNVLH